MPNLQERMAVNSRQEPLELNTIVDDYYRQKHSRPTSELTIIIMTTSFDRMSFDRMSIRIDVRSNFIGLLD